MVIADTICINGEDVCRLLFIAKEKYMRELAKKKIYIKLDRKHNRNYHFFFHLECFVYFFAGLISRNPS